MTVDVGRPLDLEWDDPTFAELADQGSRNAPMVELEHGCRITPAPTLWIATVRSDARDRRTR